MQQNDVILQKERDFSQVFSDMLLFFQQNWKRLFYLILIYAGPFLLIDGIISAYFSNFIYSRMTPGFIQYMDNYSGGMEFISEILLWYLVIVLVKVAAYTFMMVIIYGYISLYAEKGRNFDLNDVRSLALSYFFPVILASIVIGIVVVIGTLFCIIPGIYLGICLCFVYVIMLVERKGFGYAFSRSFQIAHKDFWMTLLIILAVAFSVGVIGALISLPMTGSNLIMMFKNVSGGEISQSHSIINMMLTTLTTVIMSFLTVFPLIALSLQYFNILEKEKRVYRPQQPMNNPTV